jgi:D-psicose/D-tagatose/L-ribulose 3-epimerase
MQNSIGIHAGVWVGDWSSENIVEAVAKTKAAGYDLIEVTGSDPRAIDASALRTEIEQADLRAAVSLGLTFDADVNTEDPDVLRRGRARLTDALELTSALGADHLVGCLYSALGKYPGPATTVARANAVDSVRELADAAADRGVQIGLEVVNRYETNLLNTAEQALSFIDDIDRENVTVHLDTYHMNIEEGDIARPVGFLGDRLGYVHIGESHRGYLGSGTIDWPRFFRALVAAGYRGPITFESFSTAVVDPMLSNTLAVWRNLWADNVDLARHARSFIDVQLTSATEDGR